MMNGASMKRFSATAVGIIAFALLWFASTALAETIEFITPAQGQQKLKHGALLVDVRSQQEFDDGHLSGALNIPVSKVEERIAEFGKDKNREIVVYCRTGGRAAKAKKTLEQNGYTKVFNGGGYKDWMEMEATGSKEEG